FRTTGLNFSYSVPNNRFALSGTAAVTIGGLDNLSVTFGHDTTPGLTISNGALVNLDMTVDSNFRVGSVSFGTQGLEFTYTAATRPFAVAGTAFVTVGGLDHLSVTFGHGTTPGLTIANGSLVSLD